MPPLGRTTCAAAALAMATFAALPPIAAHEGASGVVKERMDAMKSMGKAVKAMSERAKSGRDLTAIRPDAQAIRRLAANIAALFPAGSTQHPTQAKAAIWQNWADFESRAKATESESEKLASIDARDAKAISAQLRALSQACSGCHERYRAKTGHGHM